MAQARGVWVGAIAGPLVTARACQFSIRADWINISWADKDVNGGHCTSMQDGRRHSLHWRLASAHGVKVG